MTSTEPFHPEEHADEAFQLTLEEAERYEAAFVPAFFAQWASLLCDAAGVGPGQRVVDVACGTGIVARIATDRVGPRGHVAGLDLNPAMLRVAARVRPDLEWRQGDAADLPWDDGSFDVALCQMALMFLPDRGGAVAELRRVLVDGGTLALAVPAALDRQPAFAPFVDAATRLAGPEARRLLGAYFSCGDLGELRDLVAKTGATVTAATRHLGTYRAPSVEAFVATEVESTPLAARLGPAATAQLRRDAVAVLAPWTAADGRVEAPFEALVVTATR